MKTIDEVIEDIQQAQVEAGGRFMRQKEIKEMKVEELLKLLLPNDVEFMIQCNDKGRNNMKEKEVKALKTLYDLISDDGIAMSYQSLGQYRSMLLVEILEIVKETTHIEQNT